MFVRFLIIQHITLRFSMFIAVFHITEQQTDRMVRAAVTLLCRTQPM